jgi:two-component system sensor histidine kinase DesK
MFVYPALTAAGVAQYSRGPAAVVGGVVVGLFCLCFLGAGVALERRARPAFLTLLAVMALLTVLALPSAHEFGFFLAAVVVPYTAVFVPRLATPAVAGGCLAAVLVPWAVPAWHTSAGWYQAAAILFTALTVRAFAETAAANRALLEARAEVARLASQAERARIARDLHDLLGHSLTVITVKSGLARRIAGTDPVRAVAEITEVEALSRRALADVRAAVSGYREVTLATELARGRELLRAAGILAELPAGTDHIPSRQQELFGWVLREGLTNVVRHSRATRCTVRVEPGLLEIRDDGAPPARPPATGGGNGLAGLRERVAAAGGALDAGPATPQGWRLRVRLDSQGESDA